MSDLTPETIAHLRELDAARTQGEWEAMFLDELPADSYSVITARMGDRVALIESDDLYEEPHGPAGADAEFIATAANHMGALLDAAGERNQLRAAWVAHEAEVSRLRAELAEAQARIERVAALADEFDRKAGEHKQRTLEPECPESERLLQAACWGARTNSAKELRAALTPATQREEGE